MNKNLFTAMALSLLTVWGVNYMTQRYFSPIQETVSGEVALNAEVPVGQSVTVPARQDLFAPLNFLTDAPAHERLEPSQTEAVQTDYCAMQFSSVGGVMQQLSFDHYKGKKKQALSTIEPRELGASELVGSQAEESYNDGLFFVAFEQGSPRNYTLVDRTETQAKTVLEFVSQLAGWEIHKQFTLYKKSHKIELALTCEKTDLQAQSLQPRLFLPAPSVPELAGDVVSLVVLNESQSVIEKKELSSISERAWYWMTSRPIFGFENKYFVHALHDDPAHFVKRCYAKKYNDLSAVAVLEGPRIDKTTSWTMSFYCGPKTVHAFEAVDERLEELLAFGWFSWFCKMLLRLLNMLFDYVHNYGLAIILLSIILKLPFAPFSMYARTRAEQYQKFQPTIARIRAKYKDNITKQQEELMKFHADHNLSPTTPLLGCLPMLIQVPIMVSFYRILSGHIDLYQAPFFGWITDLSSHDPYYVIPILMGIFMAWQQMLTPSVDEKQRFLMMIMPLVMTGVFSGFPAGLVLYWLMSNNVLALAEDYLRKALLRYKRQA